MRTIKFRAWHKNKMWGPIGIMDKDFPGWISDFPSAAELIMFIGRKDSEGTEIYKGDVVSFQISERFTGPRSSIKEAGKKYIGSIEWDDEDAGFFIMNNDDRYPHVGLYLAENILVMGDKYNNPELLI